MASKSPSEVQQIDLTKLSLQQLQQLKNEFESVSNVFTNTHINKCAIFEKELILALQELGVFQESLQTLKIAKNKFEGSKDALEQIDNDWNEKEILVPLTGSMYVKGVVNNIDKFVIDVGTGYYVEKV